jgi:hypothetical protein
MVAATEQFLQLVDDLSFDFVTDETTDRLIDARRTLQAEVAGLVMAVQAATDTEANMTAIEICIEQLRSVDTTTKELLIASKLQVEERDALRHRALEQNVDRFRDVQRNGERTEATIRVRRALSMSHVSTEENRSPTMMEEVDQTNDTDQAYEDEMRTAKGEQQHSSPYGFNGNDEYSLGKEVPMLSTRSMNRMYTEPSLNRGVTAAAVRMAAARLRNGELSPNSDVDDVYNEHLFTNTPNRQERNRSLGDEEAESYHDRLEENMDNEREQPAFYSSDLMSKVAPWTIQSPEHGSTPSLTPQASMPTMSSGATGSKVERNRKLAQLLGEDAPLPGTVAAGASGSKLKQLLGDEVGSAVPLFLSNKPAADEKPWYLGYDYKDEEIVFTVDSNVKGGTLNALVERCTLHDTLDTNFINNFLLTYRSFTSSDEFMELLFKRFQVQVPAGLNPEEIEAWRSKKQTPIRLR